MIFPSRAEVPLISRISGQSVHAAIYLWVHIIPSVNGTSYHNPYGVVGSAVVSKLRLRVRDGICGTRLSRSRIHTCTYTDRYKEDTTGPSFRDMVASYQFCSTRLHTYRRSESEILGMGRFGRARLHESAPRGDELRSVSASARGSGDESALHLSSLESRIQRLLQ